MAPLEKNVKFECGVLTTGWAECFCGGRDDVCAAACEARKRKTSFLHRLGDGGSERT